MDGLIYNGINNIPYVGPIILMVFQVFLAIILASIIGCEREKKGHGAGLRTHIMVALGACLIMQASVGSPAFSSFSNRDPARIAAQVVSGIGFLGAGTIMQNRTNIRGLTTAATIWMCGGIGLACGSGYFIGAFICTVVATISLITLSKFEKHVLRKFPKIIMVVENKVNSFKEIIDTADMIGLVLNDISCMKQNKKSDKYRIVISLYPTSSTLLDEFTQKLQDLVKPLDFRLMKK